MTTDASHLRVLVADDDPDQRLLVRRALLAEGIADLHEAADGEEAIALAGELQPDLVVLDLVMPRRSGLEALPALAAAAPAARIVVLSSRPRWRFSPIAHAAGAVGFVEKRVPQRRIARAILLAAALVDRVGSASRTLDPSPEAAVEARSFLRDNWSDADASLLGTAELLISELVTNAVSHGTGPPRVEIVVDAGAVRVAVHDDDRTLPRPARTARDEVGGWGIRLVSTLSTTWGADETDTGKVVWFELESP